MNAYETNEDVVMVNAEEDEVAEAIGETATEAFSGDKSQSRGLEDRSIDHSN
jgi:Trk K+ transport system NAD-binding subunit